MASSATVIIVGRAMMAKTILPAKPLSPTGRSKPCCNNGTITISPKNPYTTDGIPLSNSITGFNIERIRSDATSDIYTATLNPNGKANRMANRITHNVPVNSGRMPNSGAGVAVGNHSVPANTSRSDMVLSSI